MPHQTLLLFSSMVTWRGYRQAKEDKTEIHTSGLTSSEPSWSKEAMGAGPRRGWRGVPSPSAAAVPPGASASIRYCSIASLTETETLRVRAT